MDNRRVDAESCPPSNCVLRPRPLDVASTVAGSGGPDTVNRRWICSCSLTTYERNRPAMRAIDQR